MSYPFAQAPTLEEFLEVAKSRGAIVAESTTKLTGPDGDSALRYIQKSKESAPIILTIEDGERLTPVMLTNLCRQLGIDPRTFSLSLGGLQQN